MNSRESFVNKMKEIIEKYNVELTNEEAAYLRALEEDKSAPKEGFTKNGKIILEYMQNHYNEYDNVFKAKNIGEAIEMTGRSVSGSIRKLITDGYVEKIGKDPVVYSLTEAGKSCELDK